MKRGNGTVYKRAGSKFFWITYFVNGRRIQESAETSNRTEAGRMLRQRIADIEAGKPVAFDTRLTTFSDLLGCISTDYNNNNRKMDLRGPFKHLGSVFSGDFAKDITAGRIARYTEVRLATGAAPATINRELATLRRAFNIALRQGKVTAVPLFDLLREQNVRKGFFEREQLDTVMRHLPEHLKPVIMTCYITGWRKEEVLSRKLQHVDLDAGFLRLEPGETKNGQGRMFPLTTDLRLVLSQQMARNHSWAKENATITPYLFLYQGHRLHDFKTAWHTACKAAGLPGALVHDFRRTAVRNLERAGVSRSAAMQITGHLSESVYRRYAIVDEDMMREAGAKLEKVQG